LNFATSIEIGLLLPNSTHILALTILSLLHTQMLLANPLTSSISKTTIEDLDACEENMFITKWLGETVGLIGSL
jgi:hypothetical protein